MKTLASLMLLALSAYAADNVAGKWSGNMHVTASGEQDQNVTAVLLLHQDGTELTGTLTPAGKDPEPIQKARIDGNKLSFELTKGNRSENVTPVKFDGQLAGEALKLTAEFSGRFADGERRITVTLDLKRER